MGNDARKPTLCANTVQAKFQILHNYFNAFAAFIKGEFIGLVSWLSVVWLIRI